MARIRTVKPEFWTSEQVVECSPIARLMFIGMWNFCDDYGNHPASCKTLKMEVFPGDDISTNDIELLIKELIGNNLIAQYGDGNGRHYWHVTGWHHQKIDRPNAKYPEFNKSKIISFDGNSSNDRRAVADHSPPEGKGREGNVKEGNVKEGNGMEPSVLPNSDSKESSLGRTVPVGSAQKNNLVVLEKEKKKDASATLTGDTWDAYSNAYADRYGTAPVRNATVNGQLSQFVKRIGKEESPLVAMFFVWHNAAFYVKKMHPVGLLLSDAEKLRTEWATNRSMTETQARQADKTQATGNVFNQLIEEYKREGRI